jgi:hypothetical protein
LNTLDLGRHGRFRSGKVCASAQAGRVERSEKEATSFSGPQMNVLFRFFEVSSGKSEISDILKSDQLGKHAFL